MTRSICPSSRGDYFHGYAQRYANVRERARERERERGLDKTIQTLTHSNQLCVANKQRQIEEIEKKYKD